MSSEEIAIRVSSLAKYFPIYEKPHHRLLQMLTLGEAKSKWFRRYDALKGVSFNIRKGETFGIVGRNGSGKSTLLQLICGTLTPSAGSIHVEGRIAALLELGAGFNSDFTGRENVYLNGSVLGLRKEEIDAKFDDIIGFADIGDFIDQPVRTYSSGMYIRLAFAVAINMQPDVLVIDEALSVGDEAFQRKCFAKIQGLRDAGATIVFVSHSAGVVLELCDRAILLDSGQILAAGAPRHVISRYHKMLYAPADRREKVRSMILQENENAGPIAESTVHSPALAVDLLDAQLVSGGERANSRDLPESYFDPSLVSVSKIEYEALGAEITDLRICTGEMNQVNVLRPGEDYLYCYTVNFSDAAVGVRFGMMIKTVAGMELGGGVSATLGEGLPEVPKGSVLRVNFRFRCLLAPGVYFLNAGVVALASDGEEKYLHRLVDVLPIRVMHDPDAVFTGMVDLVPASDVSVVETGGAA